MIGAFLTIAATAVLGAVTKEPKCVSPTSGSNSNPLYLGKSLIALIGKDNGAVLKAAKFVGGQIKGLQEAALEKGEVELAMNLSTLDVGYSLLTGNESETS